MTTYRINVKTIAREQHLTFHGVESYEVIDGFLHFKDVRSGKMKIFATPNCEIEEEDIQND